MGRGELLHVAVVVGEGAIAVPAGRQRGGHRCCGVRRVRLVVRRLPLVQVGDAHVVLEARAHQSVQVDPVVQHDLHVVVAGVLGEVEAEALQA
jgi:hypothetical protein